MNEQRKMPKRCPICGWDVDTSAPIRCETAVLKFPQIHDWLFAEHVFLAHVANNNGGKSDCPCGWYADPHRFREESLIRHLLEQGDVAEHLVVYHTLNKIARVGR